MAKSCSSFRLSPAAVGTYMFLHHTNTRVSNFYYLVHHSHSFNNNNKCEVPVLCIAFFPKEEEKMLNYGGGSLNPWSSTGTYITTGTVLFLRNLNFGMSKNLSWFLGYFLVWKYTEEYMFSGFRIRIRNYWVTRFWSRSEFWIRIRIQVYKFKRLELLINSSKIFVRFFAL